MNILHLSSIVVGTGLIGMASHYLKRWLRKEIEGSLLDYIVRDHPRESALAMFVFLGTAATAILSGQFDGVTVKQLLMPAFLLGYASDSGINKGTTPTSA